MFFDHEARKKFYKEELKSGDIFEHNEELFQKISACPENLQRLNSAVFPKNAITIIGKIYIRRILYRVVFRICKIWQSSYDVDAGCAGGHAARKLAAREGVVGANRVQRQHGTP